VYHSYSDPATPAKYAGAEAYLKSEYESLLPIGLANRVPAYFLVGLNATYTFSNVLKGLQVYTQVNNLFNKAPPFTGNAAASATGGTLSNPVFYDELGQAYRVGFRLSF
jgi:outer membrane receptor protein involved in Fe transport